jgi:hypothetical protein
MTITIIIIIVDYISYFKFFTIFHRIIAILILLDHSNPNHPIILLPIHFLIHLFLDFLLINLYYLPSLHPLFNSIITNSFFYSISLTQSSSLNIFSILSFYTPLPIIQQSNHYNSPNHPQPGRTQSLTYEKYVTNSKSFSAISLIHYTS